MNETDFSKTTPAMRLLGRDTSVLRSVLTDLPTTGTITHCHLEAAERAREVYAQARADRRLRRLYKRLCRVALQKKCTLQGHSSPFGENELALANHSTQDPVV